MGAHVFAESDRYGQMRVKCLRFYVTFDSVFNVFVYLLVLLQVEIKLLNVCCLFYHFQPNVNTFYILKKNVAMTLLHPTRRLSLPVCQQNNLKK